MNEIKIYQTREEIKGALAEIYRKLKEGNPLYHNPGTTGSLMFKQGLIDDNYLNERKKNAVAIPAGLFVVADSLYVGVVGVGREKQLILEIEDKGLVKKIKEEVLGIKGVDENKLKKLGFVPDQNIESYCF